MWEYRAMSDPRIAPYASACLADVDTLAQVDPGNPDINDGAFHLVRRHFDVQAFGVNAATGNAGDEMIEEHHEADDEENQTNVGGRAPACQRMRAPCQTSIRLPPWTSR